jgi:hypothetical protein
MNGIIPIVAASRTETNALERKVVDCITILLTQLHRSISALVYTG